MNVTAYLITISVFTCSVLHAQEHQDDFRCELSQIVLTRDCTQTKDYPKKSTESKDTRELTIKVAVKGPAGSIACGSAYNIDLSAAKSLANPPNQLRSPMVKLDPIANPVHYALFQGLPGCRWSQTPQFSGSSRSATEELVILGEIQIEGKLMGNDFGRKIPRLAGLIWLPISKQEKTIELKPLSKFIGKTIPLTPPDTFVCDVFEDFTMHYRISTDADYPFNVRLFSENGVEIYSMGGSSTISRPKKETTYHLVFEEDVPRAAGTYAIIKYLSELQTVAIPFEFTDIALPDGRNDKTE